MRYLLATAYLFFSIFANAQSDFLVKPYLQLGKTSTTESMQLLWHALAVNDVWVVEYKYTGETEWRKSLNQTISTVAVGSISPFKVYSTTINQLKPGSIFQYRLSKNGNIVFSSEGRSLKAADQAYRIVISGDMGSGTNTSKKIAYEIYKAKPDMVAIAGDIVYNQGLISEYKTKFWPVYNKDDADTLGAPLMRSIPFVGAVGNHDADTRDLDRFPDALAYYHFWDQPLNGPTGKEGGAFVPLLKASDANRKAFLDGAGDKYPRMTNFSFEYGNAHWTVIDSDTYVNWTDSTLRSWVINDLEKAKNATWRFVMFHHPGLHSSRAHFEQQQMRLLAPVFEKGNVDIVFSGHVHNYQRTFPMSFVPDGAGTVLVRGTENKTIHGRVVNGKWVLDKKFNGKKKTKPNGVIYIVTGAGGQGLYNLEQTTDKDSWQKFTTKFESRVHSYTLLDVNGKTLTLRQVDINGKEVDKIRIVK